MHASPSPMMHRRLHLKEKPCCGLDTRDVDLFIILDSSLVSLYMLIFLPCLSNVNQSLIYVCETFATWSIFIIYKLETDQYSLCSCISFPFVPLLDVHVNLFMSAKLYKKSLCRTEYRQLLWSGGAPVTRQWETPLAWTAPGHDPFCCPLAFGVHRRQGTARRLGSAGSFGDVLTRLLDMDPPLSCVICAAGCWVHHCHSHRQRSSRDAIFVFHR
jgi:hypothetical protein